MLVYSDSKRSVYHDPYRAVVNAGAGNIPLRLVFRKHLPLRMISNDLDVDETSKIQLFRPEHRHVGRVEVQLGYSLRLDDLEDLE